MTRIRTPLERLLARYWDGDRERLLPMIEQRFGVRVEPEQLKGARDVSSFAASLKDQVDHPGRLERVAERLLEP
jgi:hypothetical protein